MTMQSSETKQVFVFCDKCKQNVALDVRPEEIQANTTGIAGVLSVHGSPQHAILVYLDKQLRVRGCEYPSAVQVKEAPTVLARPESVVGELDKDVALTLDSLVDAFGKGRKNRTDALGDVVAQIMIKNPVYLVHDNPTVGGLVLNNLKQLFAQQETSIRLIKHEQTKSVVGLKPLVFDLQLVKFLTEGVKMDSRFFRALIKDCLDEANSYYRLRNEVSKILFAYSVIRQRLSTSATKILDTQLARESSIDFPLMPVLLKMAEIEGIDVKLKVELDGLGRAIRSF